MSISKRLIFCACISLGLALSSHPASTRDNGSLVDQESRSVLGHVSRYKHDASHNLKSTLAGALRCLALNIYWEARSEPKIGQIAVAAVTLNRVKARQFPSRICDVVRQGGEQRRYRCQFSWWCDGKKDQPVTVPAWRRAKILARLVYAGVVTDPTGGALWYHADYVQPARAAKKQWAIKIGRHLFYRSPARHDLATALRQPYPLLAAASSRHQRVPQKFLQ